MTVHECGRCAHASETETAARDHMLFHKDQDRDRRELHMGPPPASGTPSPDIIQFAIDLRHIVETAKALGLKLTPLLALEATLHIRETEARMRGLTQQGNALASIAQSMGPTG